MKVSLLWIGKSSGKHIIAGIEKYSHRIKKYHGFELEEVPNVKNSDKLNIATLKKREAEHLLKKINTDDYLVLLDEKGKAYDSEVFAGFLQKLMLQSVKRVVFVIGGAYGFAPEIKTRAQIRISLSPMTFSHQLVRIIFLEQLYRANTIIRNEPYHNA